MRYATTLLLGLLLLASQATAQETTFHVRIENVSQVGTLMPSDGSELPAPVSPGVWLVHTNDDPLFTVGMPDRDEGLERIAEDADPSTLAPALDGAMGIASSGVFNTPDGSATPGALTPGHSYTFSIKAEPGARLSFATMFGQSNDLFYAPDGNGIALFDDTDNPLDQEVTDQVFLWDAGTEVNQEPGIGPDQAPRQAAPDTGTDENGTVMLIADGMMGAGGFTYPNVAEVIRVTISVGGADPDTAPEASIDRFSEEAGTLFIRDDSNGLPGPNEPINFDQGEPFLTQGLGPNGEFVKYYNFDVQPVEAAPLYMLIREGEDSPVEGQHNIIDVIPGDEDYNDFWHIHRVTVPADYVANSITSVSAITQAGYPIEVTDTIVNCPVVPDGSTASLRLNEGNPSELITGWYRDQVVHYFLFTEVVLTRTAAGEIPISPIFVSFNVNPDQPGGGPASGFMTEDGSAQTHNVVATLPSDDNYSPLWSVNVYDNADFSSVRNLVSAQAATILGSGVALVNCPIVSVAGRDPETAPAASIDRFSEDAGMLFVRDGSNGLPGPNEPINFDQGEPFLAQGFGPDGEIVQYYNFDVQPTEPAPIYRFFREGEDTPVEGQGNVIGVIPGDEDYNDFWHLHRVTVPADYVANTITSVVALLDSGYPIEAMDAIVNCPVVPEGSTASLRFSDGNPTELIQGWYQDQVVYYFLFAEAPLTRTASDEVPISPIFVSFNVNPDQPGGGPASGFMTEDGSAQTHNVVATLPGDDNYSPLWSVNVYDNADFASVSDLTTAQAANILGSGVALVNCPIVSADIDTAIEPGAPEQPEGFVLHGNYPNPFNPETIIRYDLNEPGHVQLRIFDGLGREVVTLVNAPQATGTFEARWNGRDAAGRRLASGVYFYRITLDQQVSQTRVMTLLK